MPPLSVMIKPASGACNMRCRYCFYADEMQLRQKPSFGMMSEKTLEQVIRKTLEQAERECTIAFQGGEPTLAGLSFYEKAVALQKKYNHKGLVIHNAIQTNGLNIDDNWAAFFAENHVLVGISLDGPLEQHDRYRVDTSGNGTHQRVMEASRILKSHHVDYNILSVVTKQSARSINQVYGFFAREKLDFQQYIPCMDPLEMPYGQQPYSLSVQNYREYLCKLFDLWYTDAKKGKLRYNRTFYNYLMMLQGLEPESCNMCGSCSIQYVVEADGSVYPCDFYALDAWKLGNLNTDSFAQLDQKRRELGFVQQSRTVPTECRSCRWYKLCRNGCRRDRELLPDGTLGKNRYCKAFEPFFEYAVPKMLSLLRSGALHQQSDQK